MSLMKSLGMSVNDRETAMADAILREAGDIDGDGELTRAEFNAAKTARRWHEKSTD